MEFDAGASSHPLTHLINQQVRTLQIISTALVMGVCMMGMVLIPQGMQRAAANAPAANPPAEGAEGVQPPPPPQAAPPQLGMLSMLAVGMLVVCGTASTIIPRAIVAKQLKAIAESGGPPAKKDGEAREAYLKQLLSAFTTQHVVRAALVEGPAFMGLFAYMQEGHFAALVVPAVSIAILFSTFPTPARVTSWIEQCMAGS